MNEITAAAPYDTTTYRRVRIWFLSRVALLVYPGYARHINLLFSNTEVWHIGEGVAVQNQ
jgi:hypothetical protein